MQLFAILEGHKYEFVLPGHDLSIPLHFNGQQPNTYGVEKAISKAWEGGGFVGDTRRGGSCNFEKYELVPHCNGTHTECVGHITNERLSIHKLLTEELIPATLISVTPEKASDTVDSYDPPLNPEDSLISVSALRSPLSTLLSAFCGALIIRTLPNPSEKKFRDSTKVIPPFFSLEAMHLIRKIGFRHLLVDFPSLDRLHDDGKLSTHHIFWELAPGSHEMPQEKTLFKTVTEFIYVPDEVKDGNYLLNLQIAPFDSDASPSRPVVFALVD